MELLEVSEEENYRSIVLNNLIDESISRKEAAAKMNLSLRQLDRLKASYIRSGVAGLVHGNRGRRSNHAMSEENEATIINLVRNHYHDFGPTLASEKLDERHQVQVSREKLRLLMIKEGLWKGKTRKGSRAYSRRTRRSRRGELLQGDASPHAWFEDRAPKCDLVSFIDDATGEISARFEPSETTLGYMRLLKDYVVQKGCPLALYVDKSSIFRVNNGTKPGTGTTAFGEVLKDLNIELICAHSPQAKGRVERMYGTFQDRVIKEMRLHGVSSIEEGNSFLKWYLPIYNKRFNIEPSSPENAHIPLPGHLELQKVFSIREQRKLSKSLDFSLDGTIYQVVNCTTPRRVMNQPIMIYLNLDGDMWGECRGQQLEIEPYYEQVAGPQIMSRKHLDAFLNRKEPITVQQKINRKVRLPV